MTRIAATACVGLPATAMCQQNYALGEYRQAIDVLKQTLEPLWGALVRFAGAISRSWIAVCLANLGEFLAALAVAGKGLRIAEIADHHSSIVNLFSAQLSAVPVYTFEASLGVRSRYRAAAPSPTTTKGAQ
jgi:tetratricopeptide (TPR) repeat protein